MYSLPRSQSQPSPHRSRRDSPYLFQQSWILPSSLQADLLFSVLCTLSCSPLSDTLSQESDMSSHFLQESHRLEGCDKPQTELPPQYSRLRIAPRALTELLSLIPVRRLSFSPPLFPRSASFPETRSSSRSDGSGVEASAGRRRQGLGENPRQTL